MKSESGRGESGGISGGITKTFEWGGSVPEGVVCPDCFGELRGEGQALVCVACGRKYPVVDGIPVLIVERAERG
jgi:hypothetical protein